MDSTLNCLTGAEARPNDAVALPLVANPGFVYFIRAGRTNAVKIGYASNVESRLRELQCANASPLHLLGFMPGTLEDEWAWHERFAHCRIRGEWFDLGLDLREAINGLAIERDDFTRFLRLSVLTRNAR